MIAVIVGAIVAALIALARWWHGREVITAEQRGRLDAIEQVRRDPMRRRPRWLGR